jgi:hypothetical protein
MEKSKKHILILGGYGRAGIETAKNLLKRTSLHLILAGRDAETAQKSALDLNRVYGDDCTSGIRVDASDAESLESAFKQCDLVAVCMPYRDNARLVLEKALAAGIDYIDINGDKEKHEILKELSYPITRAHLSYLLEGGEVPGLPSALALLAGRHLDRVHKIVIGSVWKDPDMPYGSVYDIMTHLGGNNPPFVYREGVWRKVPLIAARRIFFGSPYGWKTCFPIDLHEMRGIPEIMGVDHIGVYQAGINWFVDSLALIWSVLGLGKGEKALQKGIRLFLRGNKLFTRKPFGMAVALDAVGVKGNERKKLSVRLSHNDLYTATGIVLAAFIFQMIDGTIKRPGVYFAGHAADGDRLLQDCNDMGMGLTMSMD